MRGFRANRRRIAALAAGAFLIAGCGGSSQLLETLPSDPQSGDSIRPITLELTAGGGALLYFGVEHTACPEHPRLAELERCWQSFCPTLACTEGGVWDLWGNREQAIRRNGEGGLTRFLAQRDSVPIVSLEPSRAREVARLRRYFSARDLKLFYVLRQVPLYRNVPPAPPLDGYITGLIQRLGEVRGLQCPPRSLEELDRLCRSRFPHLENWRVTPADWFDPEGGDFILNRIARRCDEIRDAHMARFLAAAVQDGERVFAVAGYRHVLAQEDNLRGSLQKTPK